MRNLYLALFFILLSSQVFASIPQADKQKMINALDTMQYIKVWPGPLVVYPKIREFKRLCAKYENESNAEWASFFTDYFETKPLRTNLLIWLKKNAFEDWFGTRQTRDKLHWGLYQGIKTNEQLKFVNINWDEAFSTDNFNAQTMQSFSGMMFILTFNEDVTHDFINSTATHYKNIINAHPTYLKKNYLFDPNVHPLYLSGYREQLHVLLGAVGKKFPERRLEMGEAIGIPGLEDSFEQALFYDHGFIVQDNGVLDNEQFEIIHTIMSLMPPIYKNQITCKNYPGRSIFQVQSLGSFNILQRKVGEKSTPQLHDGLPDDLFDSYSTIVYHELMHQMDGVIARKDPYFRDQRLRFLKEAGEDNFNYLRFNINAGFFKDNPQEWIASSAGNHYIEHTRRSFNDAMKRQREQGRLLPITNWLYIADLLSNKGDSVFNFVSGHGPGTRLQYDKIKVDRNQKGRIIRVYWSDCEVYEFERDPVTEMVSAVKEPEFSATLSEGGCVDLDMDNDGILNSNEGYRQAKFDQGMFGRRNAPFKQRIQQNGVPDNNKLFIWARRRTPAQKLEFIESGGKFSDRDPSNDGSEMHFSGNYRSNRAARTIFNFAVPVNDLSFVVTDVDKGTGSGAEWFMIKASYQGNTIMLDASNIQNLTPQQSLPSLNNNVFNGSNAGSSNTFRVSFKQPVDRIEFVAKGTTRQDTGLDISVFNLEWSLDYDGDGISNNHDLDSDNDGCPDAVEGSKNIDFDDLLPNWTIYSYEDQNGVPLLATGGQNAGTSTNEIEVSTACTSSCFPSSNAFIDTDGDGVGNVCDVDADNDGIYNDVENENPTILEWKNISNFTSKPPKDITTQVSLHNGGNQTVNLHAFTKIRKLNAKAKVVTGSNQIFSNADPSFNDGYYQIEGMHQASPTNLLNVNFNEPVYRLQFNIAGIDAFSPTLVERVEVNAYHNDEIVTLNSANVTLLQGAYGPSQTNNIFESNQQSSDKNVISIQYETPIDSIKIWVTGKSYASEVSLGISNMTWADDFDNDGMPNYLDLDSDGDGCWDALEGTTDFQASELDNGSFMGPFNENGILTILPNGQGGGSFLDDSIQSESCVFGLTNIDDNTDEEDEDSNKEEEQAEAIIYPNPVKIGNLVKIEYPNIQNLLIINQYGVVVYTDTLNGDDVVSVPTSNFKEGQHYIMINKQLRGSMSLNR